MKLFDGKCRNDGNNSFPSEKYKVGKKLYINVDQYMLAFANRNVV